MRVLRGLLLGLLLIGVLGVAAQDEPPAPVWTVLDSVPDTPEARATFSYADYAAISAGVTGEDEIVRALIQVYSGPQLDYFAERLEDQEALIGVPFFAIGQGAYWGTPPPAVTLFQGEFDAEAVQAAYAARDYALLALNGLTLFCGPEGCDTGSMINLDMRAPGDPFGGEIGRPQPVLFVPLEDGAQILSSPVLEAVEASAEAATGETPSLTDSPDVQAAVRGAIGDGVLRQAIFATAEAMGPVPEGVVPLPAYLLAVLGETETEEGLSASVTLAYPTLGEAEDAAAALEARLEAYVTERTGEPYTELLKERGLLTQFSTYEDADTGLAVAQVVFSGPDDAGAFRLLVQGYYMRDLGWLGIE